MSEIIKTYTQEIGPVRFIGLKYGDQDRDEYGGFGKQWGEWTLKSQMDPILPLLGSDPKALYEDGGAPLGLMRWKENEPFQYWIGMFAPAGADVPDGYGFVDFPKSRLGVCWLKGTMDNLFGKEESCAKQLTQEGYEIIGDADGAFWFFERYSLPRFDSLDQNGEIILDIVHYIK